MSRFFRAIAPCPTINATHCTKSGKYRLRHRSSLASYNYDCDIEELGYECCVGLVLFGKALAQPRGRSLRITANDVVATDRTNPRRVREVCSETSHHLAGIVLRMVTTVFKASRPPKSRRNARPEAPKKSDGEKRKNREHMTVYSQPTTDGPSGPTE